MSRVVAALVAMVSASEATLNIPTKEIAPGIHMPMAGLGTWQYNSSVAEGAVKMALDFGCRSIDTANMYENQVGVGKAIAAAGFQSGERRKELFLTTKVPGALGFNGTMSAHEDNLKQLGLDYVDLLLVHFPCNFDGKTGCDKADRQATWKGLEQMHKAGKARAIGVSHYCQQHLEDVLEIATEPVAINQQEWHVGMGPDPEGVRSFGEKHGVTFQSFSPLCGPCGDKLDKELITGELVTRIGKKYNVSGPQVALRWLVENGSPVIAKTDKLDHLKEDLDLFRFKLTPEELASLNAATSPPSVETVASDCKIKSTVVV
jgi:diketogulonate reductase-like aldo/keto reductase